VFEEPRCSCGRVTDGSSNFCAVCVAAGARRRLPPPLPSQPRVPPARDLPEPPPGPVKDLLYEQRQIRDLLLRYEGRNPKLLRLRELAERSSSWLPASQQVGWLTKALAAAAPPGPPVPGEPEALAFLESYRGQNQFLLKLKADAARPGYRLSAAQVERVLEIRHEELTGQHKAPPRPSGTGRNLPGRRRPPKAKQGRRPRRSWVPGGARRRTSPKGA
jgi:hypothetical protein